RYPIPSAISTTSPTSRASRRSRSASPTPSGSVVTTPAWCSGVGTTPSRNRRRAPLEKERVAPHAVDLRDALPTADDAEADPLVESEAGEVLGEDARLDRPDPAPVGAVDEGLHQRSTDPAPAGCGRDVDAVLGHACVARAPRDRHQRRPAEDVAVVDGDE